MSRWITIDLGVSGGDQTVEMTVETVEGGKLRVTRINQLYGEPDRVISPGQKHELDLVKGKDGVWR